MDIYAKVSKGDVDTSKMGNADTVLTKKQATAKALFNPSDENVKTIESVSIWDKKPCDDEWWYDDDLLKAYRNLDSVIFSYNEEGQELDPTVGDETRSGVIAQQVEKEPLLAAAVKTDPDTGYKMLDMRQVAASNMAAIAEISKQLKVMEEQIHRIIGDEMIRGSN